MVDNLADAFCVVHEYIDDVMFDLSQAFSSAHTKYRNDVMKVPNSMWKDKLKRK